MIKRTVVGPTARKGRVTKPKDPKGLTNETPIYVMIEQYTPNTKTSREG
jgi:hypothetical protein